MGLRAFSGPGSIPALVEPSGTRTRTLTGLRNHAIGLSVLG